MAYFGKHNWKQFFLNKYYWKQLSELITQYLLFRPYFYFLSANAKIKLTRHQCIQPERKHKRACSDYSGN